MDNLSRAVHTGKPAEEDDAAPLSPQTVENIYDVSTDSKVIL